MEALKQAFFKADKEYQFAIASGNLQRIGRALKNRRKAFAALDRAKKSKFQKTFVSQYGMATS